MKQNKKGLIFLPLLALVLTGCVSTFEPEDKPEQAEDYFTPEGEYDLETSESEESDYSDQEESYTYSYSLVIQNKEDLESICVDESSQDSSYTLEINLNTYIDDVLDSTSSASADDVYISSTNPNIISTDGLDLVLGSESGEVTLSVYWLDHIQAYDSLTINYSYLNID